MSGRVRVAGWPGLAYRVVGPDILTDFETGEETDTGRVLVCAIGDDRIESVDVDDLTPLDDDAYCHDCGQTCCAWDLADE